MGQCIQKCEKCENCKSIEMFFTDCDVVLKKCESFLAKQYNTTETQTLLRTIRSELISEFFTLYKNNNGNLKLVVEDMMTYALHLVEGMVVSELKKI
jgi:hypothetical protein